MNKPPIFKVGDTVKLKSGSISMTVSQPEDNDGFVWCMWYYEGAIESYRFYVDTLKESK